MLTFDVKRLLIAWVMAAAVASIAACGGGSEGGAVGGGSGSAPVQTDVPASALASVDGLVTFMNQLIDSGTNDTGEPITLGDASMPVNDAI